MNKSALIEQLKSKKQTWIKIAFTDIDGVLRGKIIHIDKLIHAFENQMGFCEVVFGWDSQDMLYPKADLAGWHNGFPDTLMNLDSDTLREIPWENQLPFLMADFSQSDHPACPRNLLKKIAARTAKLGFETKFAQEFEWFFFHQSDHSPISSGMFGYSHLRLSQNSEFVQQILQNCAQFGITIEGFHTETGPGVYEACIQPDEILKAADHAVLFKSAIKELAYKHGYQASFMAKQKASLPGCGGHIHQSLWSMDKNLFYNPTTADHMSDTMKSYLAGQLYCLPFIIPMFAPTINSYKRLVPDTWAPTTVSWGIENRTTALRALNNHEKLTRLEMRVPGADVNPYLAFAASLASGLYGIEHKLSLNDIETKGNAYTSKQLKKLPNNLSLATATMRNSKIAKALFGDYFVKHFCMSREWEVDNFNKHVTDWEKNRYFEII